MSILIFLATWFLRWLGVALVVGLFVGAIIQAMTADRPTVPTDHSPWHLR